MVKVRELSLRQTSASPSRTDAEARCAVGDHRDVGTSRDAGSLPSLFSALTPPHTVYLLAPCPLQFTTQTASLPRLNLYHSRTSCRPHP